MRNRIICLLIITLLSIGLLSCQDAGSGKVRIGFVADLSGRMSTIGSPGRDAALLAVEEVNRRGGINGRPAELVVRDNRHNEQELIEVIKELQNAGVEIIVGPMTSQMGVAVANAPELQETVFISPTVSTSQLSGIKDNFYRIYPHIRILTERLAEYLHTKKSVENVAAVLDLSNAAFSKSWVESFSEKLTHLGVDVAPPITFNSTAKPQYEKLVQDIRTAQADTVLVVASAMDLAIIAQQIDRAGLNVDIYATEWSYSDELIEIGSKSSNGIKLIHTFDQKSKSEKFLAFKEVFAERYAYKPNFAAAYSYEATLIAASALGKDAGKELSRRISQLKTFSGLQTDLQFDQFGDVERQVFISEIIDGQFQRIDKR